MEIKETHLMPTTNDTLYQKFYGSVKKNPGNKRADSWIFHGSGCLDDEPNRNDAKQWKEREEEKVFFCS